MKGTVGLSLVSFEEMACKAAKFRGKKLKNSAAGINKYKGEKETGHREDTMSAHNLVGWGWGEQTRRKCRLEKPIYISQHAQALSVVQFRWGESEFLSPGWRITLVQQSILFRTHRNWGKKMRGEED